MGERTKQQKVKINDRICAESHRWEQSSNTTVLSKDSGALTM